MDPSNKEELQMKETLDLAVEVGEEQQSQLQENFDPQQELTDESGQESGEAEEKKDLPAKDRKNDKLYEILDWLKYLVIVIVLGLLITNYVIQRNTVEGSSMFPTLKSGDELLVEKVSRYFGAIHRGDIITVDTHGVDAEHPNRVIKRVIGLPGEQIEIRDGKVYINGQLFEEGYLEADVVTNPHDPRYEEVKLGENEYYCLGDNRGGSKDSRNFGPIPADHILGKLLIRFYPFNRFGRP